MMVFDGVGRGWDTVVDNKRYFCLGGGGGGWGVVVEGREINTVNNNRAVFEVRSPIKIRVRYVQG